MLKARNHYFFNLLFLTVTDLFNGWVLYDTIIVMGLGLEAVLLLILLFCGFYKNSKYLDWVVFK